MAAAVDPEAALTALVARVLARPGVVVVLGGIDTGKTTVASAVLLAALGAGMRPAYVDTDLGQSTVGPPATVGLRILREPADLVAPIVADRLYFVGDVSPPRQRLALLAGTTRLMQAARRRARLVVLDTSGYVSGILGQSLKFHKLEVARPDWVVGLQRGEELEPLLGVARRFTSAEVAPLPVHPAVVPTGVEQRAEHRRAGLARYFAGELHRYRVRPTVFVPTLPPRFDATLLHGLLVGLSDGRGGSTGLGVLEHADGVLRLATPSPAAPSGLRLGSVRVDAAWNPRSVDLRSLLGSA